MKRRLNLYKFTSAKIQCDQKGYVGQELFREVDGKSQVAATVVFWDVMGQFSVETNGEVPLVILEELIAEAKSLISTPRSNLWHRVFGSIKAVTQRFVTNLF